MDTRKCCLIVLVPALTLASLLTAGCTVDVTTHPSPTPSTAFATYESPNYDFTITYPEGWYKEEQQEAAVVFVLPTHNASENINVVVRDVPSNMTLDRYTQIGISEAQQYPNSKLLESTNTTLAGQPGHKIVFAATIDGDDLTVMQVFTIVQNTGYIITYRAAPQTFSTYLSTVQEMVNSFNVQVF